MRGARKISWGGVVRFSWTTKDLVVVVWAPSAYLFEHEQNCVGQRPRMKLNVSGKLGKIIKD